MTLQEISSWLNQSLRFKLNEAQITIILNETHKLACDQNVLAFQYWDNFLTTYQEILFDSVGYTPADPTDIGKTAVGGSSGSTGIIISFDNATFTWVIDTNSPFLEGEPITVTTGIGAGNLVSGDIYQQGYLGPYAFPASPPVRKMTGVSNVSDGQIFGEPFNFVLPYGTEQQNNNLSLRTRDDYGLIFSQYNQRNFYIPARIDNFAKTLTLINRPALKITPRWVYFRAPEKITDILNDDDKVLIPETYHMNWVQCLIECAQVTTKNQMFTREHVEGHFAEWWETLKQDWTPNGKDSNQVNEGTI